MSDQAHSCPPGPFDQSALNISTRDKFVMVLSLPKVLLKKSKEFQDSTLKIKNLEMTVFGTVIPEVSVPSVETRILGQSYNITSLNRPNYSPLNISFIVDNEYKNYHMLWQWLNLYNDAETAEYNGPDENRGTLLTEYQTTFSIFGLTEYNSSAAEFRFNNAFITKLGPITYDYKTSEQIECSAEFVFNQLLVKPIRKK
jgi:hypothetical protein